jgi:hypothetical protein
MKIKAMDNLFTTIINEADRDEVLIEFALSGGSATDTADWISRHPAHASDIALFAADQWVCGKDADALATSNAQTAAIATVGMDVLRRMRPQMAPVVAPTAANVVVRPLNSLLAAAKAQGLDADDAAALLDIPQPLFVKLHRRLIALESIPRDFINALASAVGRTADEIAAYLRQPPTLAAGASFRADDTPTVGTQESFADALRSDPEAMASQREKWLN